MPLLLPILPHLPRPHPHTVLYNNTSWTEYVRSANRLAKPASSMIGSINPE